MTPANAVRPGLNPNTHSPSSVEKTMDCRLNPGNDELWG